MVGEWFEKFVQTDSTTGEYRDRGYLQLVASLRKIHIKFKSYMRVLYFKFNIHLNSVRSNDFQKFNER